MAKVRFQPGIGGGQETRWAAGQSGNPAGKPKARIEFERALADALITEGSAEEVAKILWGAARNGAPWAVQLLLQRLAPQDQSLRLVHERGIDHDGIDYSQLTDEQIEQLRAILERTAGNTLCVGDGSGTPELA